MQLPLLYFLFWNFCLSCVYVCVCWGELNYGQCTLCHSSENDTVWQRISHAEIYLPEEGGTIYHPFVSLPVPAVRKGVLPTVSTRLPVFFML